MPTPTTVSSRFARRSCLLAIAIFAGTEAPAVAQPLLPAPQIVSHPPRMVVVTPPPRRSNLGGGFIEHIFGHSAPQRAIVVPPPPSAYVQPQQSPPPLYVHTAPLTPLYERPATGFRLDPKFLRQQVPYYGDEAPGTIVIDTQNHFLYLVQEGGTALRYGIGVGRPGFTWSGVHRITAKKEWPDWIPPKEMLERQPYLPHFMPGGPDNPLGARALYLGSTLYRIHGSNEPWTIGQNVSSGCIRMRNVDVIDLYERVKVGAKVVVL